MSSKPKRAAGLIPSSQLLDMATSFANSANTTTTTTFTDGAIEGLRISHHTFLHRLAEEIAKQDKDVVSQKDVLAAMNELGLSELAQEAVGLQLQQQAGGTTTGSASKKWKKSKSKVKWTKEMEEEQEKLLAQSKEAMEAQAQQAQGK